jgi:hypothetical protein
VGPTCRHLLLPPAGRPFLPRAAAGHPLPPAPPPRLPAPVRLLHSVFNAPPHSPTAVPAPSSPCKRPHRAAINGRPPTSPPPPSRPSPSPLTTIKGAPRPPLHPAPLPFSPPSPQQRRRRSSPPEPRPRRRSPPPPCLPPLRPLGKFSLPLLFLFMPFPWFLVHGNTLPASPANLAGARRRAPPRPAVRRRPTADSQPWP